MKSVKTHVGNRRQAGVRLGRFGLLYGLAGLALLGISAGCSDSAPPDVPVDTEPTEMNLEASGQPVDTPSNVNGELENAGASTNVTDVSSQVTAAPNGAAWPANAGYVSGYDRLSTDGLSEVTVDNSANDDDVFVKLFALNSGQPKPVRHIFIPAHGQFTMGSIAAGRYDVRYMNLGNGGLARSEDFTLQEIDEAGGTRYSSIRMTLYKVPDGNMQTYPIDPAEFESP